MEDNYLNIGSSNTGSTAEYEKYGPKAESEGNSESADACAPIDVPGAQKEIIFQVEMQDPEYGHVKPVYGAVSSKFKIVLNILYAIFGLETIAIAILEPGSLGIAYCIAAGIVIGAFLLIYVVMPGRRKKTYKQMQAAGELDHRYTFYQDCVNVKGKIGEATLKYDTAQYYAENAYAMVVVFQFGKSIVLDKSKCSDEQLKFIRSVVPESSLKAAQSKSLRKMITRVVVVVIAICLLSTTIYTYATNYPIHTEYAATTYVSFSGCVKEGNIKDVVIIQKKYVEYTFTGRGNEERYYTVLDGSLDELIDMLDKYDVNWEFK